MGHCKNCERPNGSHVDGKCLFDATYFEPMNIVDFSILTLKRVGATDDDIRQFTDKIRGTRDHNG